jgi:chromosome segregation ATPase
MDNKPKEKLEEFSELLIKLGKEIEEKLLEKRKLEGEIKRKEEQVLKLGKDVFTARQRVAHLSTDLAKLEEKRRKFEEEKLLLKKEERVSF